MCFQLNSVFIQVLDARLLDLVDAMRRRERKLTSLHEIVNNTTEEKGDSIS